jgi:hypothetical protein
MVIGDEICKVQGARFSTLAECRSKALEAGLGIRFMWEQIRIPEKRFYESKNKTQSIGTYNTM